MTASTTSPERALSEAMDFIVRYPEDVEYRVVKHTGTEEILDTFNSKLWKKQNGSD